MYVCFGFPVDRLRRARTIDLQCQSLSLSSFLLCNVTASVTRTVDFRWPARPQNRSKIIGKIDRKSIPGEASGHSKSIENRSRDPPGRFVAPKGVSKGSRERLGSVLGRPWRVPGAPGGSPSVTRDARKSAWERPGARRGGPNRRQVASGNEKFEFSSHGSLADRFSTDFRSIFARFSDVHASRSGSALTTNFGRFSVRARKA